MLTGSAGREISKEEDALPLIPSSTMLELRLCGHRRQSVPSDDIVQNVEAGGCVFQMLLTSA